MHQSMSTMAVQVRIDMTARNYGYLIANHIWTLEHAHNVLKSDDLSLFEIAGLAKAIACFQCSE